MACLVTCQTSYTSMVFEGGIYVDFTQSSQIVAGVKSGVYLKKQGNHSFNSTCKVKIKC